jgi:hypothetical protein
MTGRYVNLIDTSWMSEEFNLHSRIKLELPEHLPALATEMSRAVDLVQKLSDRIDALGAMLRAAQKIVDERVSDGGLDAVDTAYDVDDEDEDEINMLEYNKKIAADNAPKKRKSKNS